MVLKEKENVSGSMIKLNWAFKIVSLKQNDAIDFFFASYWTQKQLIHHYCSVLMSRTANFQAHLRKTKVNEPYLIMILKYLIYFDLAHFQQ